ncbi:MAG: hypothetical protein NTZ02_00680 [Candidatus Woesearchaeota archaeon]|nr:hypothetical protein [Candidatus Woesearchaeota archaeon]
MQGLEEVQVLEAPKEVEGQSNNSILKDILIIGEEMLSQAAEEYGQIFSPFLKTGNSPQERLRKTVVMLLALGFFALSPIKPVGAFRAFLCDDQLRKEYIKFVDPLRDGNVYYYQRTGGWKMENDYEELVDVSDKKTLSRLEKLLIEYGLKSD